MRTPRHSIPIANDARLTAGPRVAYQGRPGAFGEQAARAWRESASVRPVRSFVEVLNTVWAGAAEWGVIPVWNSMMGRVVTACAALDQWAPMIERIDEIDVAVRHCVLALPGTALDDVRFVGSHPAAFAQCTRFLAERALVACDAYNTAGAAHELSVYRLRADLSAEPWYARLPDAPSRLGVIASADAARHYGLDVLARDVQDDAENLTRFAVVRARSGRALGPGRRVG